MTDSSLTTPLPHLKSLYYTHMDGLAVSGSHGRERVPQLHTPPKVYTLCHAGTRLYIKQPPQVEVGHRHVP